MDKQQRWLLKRFHTVCGKLGMSSDDKKEVIAAYGCESSADLNNDDLLDLCFKLEKNLDPALAELDRWRKSVMKSIGVYLEFIDRDQSADLIKAIACRATNYTDFNRIPVEQLRNVYYAFTKKTKVFKASWKEMEEQLCLKK